MEFMNDLFAKAKKLKINTCIDTAGEPFTRRAILRTVRATDDKYRRASL